MQLEVAAANILATAMADLLAGGRVRVRAADGTSLADCDFASPPFAAPQDGAIAAHPFPPARGLADGRPAGFTAYDASGKAVLSGTAGHKDDDPPPEMQFRTRMIVEDADVLVESFVFAVLKEPK